LKKVVNSTSYKWLVVPNGILELVVLHEENVSNIQLPGFVLAAELSGLSEQLLDLGIVGFVPVSFGLHHQHGDVLVQSSVILMKSCCDGW
jgi:hypothetical protein